MAKPCYFYDKLPAELRNEIYILAFASSDDGRGVRLINAAPPSKALVMTCRQAHAESAKLYKAMYREYWRTNKFSVTICKSSDPRAGLTDRVPSDRARDINHIEHLTVRLAWTTGSGPLTLEDARGLWSLTDKLYGVRYKVLRKVGGNRCVASSPMSIKQDALDRLAQASSYCCIMDQLHYFVDLWA